VPPYMYARPTPGPPISAQIIAQLHRASVLIDRYHLALSAGAFHGIPQGNSPAPAGSAPDL
jgi:hypothetical protein